MSWSPDGQLLAFIEISPTTGRHIWTLRMGDPSLDSGQVRKAAAVPPITVHRKRAWIFPQRALAGLYLQ